MLAPPNRPVAACRSTASTLLALRTYTVSSVALAPVCPWYSFVAVWRKASVLVPFGAYAGVNSGIAIEALANEAFRKRADTLFGFNSSEHQARTAPGWLTPEMVDPLVEFCHQVSAAYAAALEPPASM